MTTRGENNNNPGNLRKTTPLTQWQGLAEDQPDHAFVSFSEMYWGVRAMARVLINYKDKSGIQTISGIIAKWAPAADHNNEGAYVTAVCGSSGFTPTQVVDLHSYADLKPIMVGMIKVECAGLVLPDAVMDRGLALAGVESVTRPSRTIKAALVAGAATVVPYVPDALQAIGDQSSVLRGLQTYWPYAGGLATIATLCSVAYIVWRKMADRAALKP